MKMPNYLMSSKDENQDGFIDLHDRCIGEIIVLNDRVRFAFVDGFQWINPFGVKSYSFGYIDYMNTVSEDFFCYMIHRRRNRLVLSPTIKVLSLKQLNRIIMRRNLCIEVYLELISENHYHLRGELRTRFKQKACYKSSIIIIEMMDNPLRLYFGVN